MTGPDRLSLGSRFRMDMRRGRGYKITNTVVELEEDRLIAWRHVGAHRWRYVLTPTDDGGTSVTETWDLSPYPRFAAALLDRLYGAQTQRAIEATLATLKDAAESDVGTSTP